MKYKHFIEKWLPELLDTISEEEVKQDLNSLDNWISVEDELPKDSGYLLVCENEFGTQSILYGYYDGKKFQTVCGLGGFSDIRPTHWQPLPKPPKE